MEILVNFMEHLVNQELDNYLEGKDICKCDKCLIDIKAFALNKLTPHYIVTEKGYIFQKIAEMKTQFKVDVLKAVVEAVEIVSKKPRHN